MTAEKLLTIIIRGRPTLPPDVSVYDRPVELAPLSVAFGRLSLSF